MPKEPQRIDKRYILEEISSVLNFDKGIFYTIKELCIRPGHTVRKYISGDRKRIVKPIFFLIICSLIYTIAQEFLSFEAGFISYTPEDENETPITVEIYEWFSRNYGYANILMAIFIAFWIRILFKNYNYNYYEVFILLCFVMGNSILIYALLGIIGCVINYSILQLGLILTSIYNAWAIGQFFDRKKKINYVKGFSSYVFGSLSCVIVIYAIGSGLDELLH